MPIHDHLGRITSQQPGGLWNAKLVTVTDVDTQATDNDVDRGREPWVRRIVGVAMDRVYRGDQREFVEDLVAADVTGVENELHSTKGIVNRRPHETVRVGNQADSMHAGGSEAMPGMVERSTGDDFDSDPLGSGPAWQLVLHAQVIENATYDKINQRLDALRPMVEAG